MTKLSILILFGGVCLLHNVESKPTTGVTASVSFDSKSGRFTLLDHKVDSQVAEARFDDQRYTNGWTQLSVTTSKDADDKVQAYAAGLAEGYITRDIIAQHWNNTVKGYCNPEAPSPYCQRLKAYVNDNVNSFVQAGIKAYAKTDPYWHQVELFLYQLNGLIDGFHSAPGLPKTTVDPFDFMMFQISGDLEDLEVALKKPSDLRNHVLGSGSCSALIKLLPENSDVYIAHDTWNSYQSMLRILKRYEFHYHLLDAPGQPLVPGNTMVFSSYPGYLYSGDDFYLMSSGIVAVETTIGNSNPNLNVFIQPENTVLEGIRNQVANRLADSGSAWAKVFSRYNSGTYNNQWMILNYNRFSPHTKLQSGLLVVLEQLPGMTMWDDVTSVLEKQTYWASYNSPYFQTIFNASGVPSLVTKYGDWFSYDKTPRARIFRRDHQNVKDISSMIKLMRYNDYKHDELSKCDCEPPYSAENAISARSDLNPKNGTYPFGALGHRSHGGTDMKMTSWKASKEMGFYAQAGPTFDDQPPFSWSTADFAADTPHEGHPDTFAFKPVYTVFWP